MRLSLIEAERDINKPPTSDWFDRSTKRFFCPSLSLINIASQTPRTVKMKLVDEKFETVDWGDLPDIAAISYKTMSVKRAYELADIYKTKGTKVILGGPHASLMPQEAKMHCHSVVTGEGEEIWPQVIDDLNKNRLQDFYRAPRLVDIAGINLSRHDLLNNESYVFHSIQTSRGCSLGCDFCPTREMFGGVFRTKPVHKVIREIKHALSVEKKRIFFVDDIFCAGNETFMLDLLKKIRRLRIRFYAISDFLVLNNNLVTELAKSGCHCLCLNIPGTCRPEDEKLIDALQAAGINVWGYFMFGFPSHGPDIFEKAHDLIGRTKMRHASFTVMAPYPNTKMGISLAGQGRILSEDWSLYDQTNVIYKPDKMGPQELEKGFKWIKEKLGRLSYHDSKRE